MIGEAPDGTASIVKGYNFAMAEDDDPARNRLLLARERKVDLGTRCRTVSGAIVAVVWGVLGESKFSGLLDGLSRKVLIFAAALGVLAFFLDYAQTLFEYLDAKLLTGRFLAFGGFSMFVAKQIVTCGAAAMLLFGVGRLITAPDKASAQSDDWSIWLGYVIDNASPDEKKDSTLYLKLSDPNTGDTVAKKDGLSCTGTLAGNQLQLNCGRTLQLQGTFIKDQAYAGTWTNADPQAAGMFRYDYSKQAGTSVHQPASVR